MLIIAERINATRKGIGSAIKARNAELIRKEALNQTAAGCDYIDVNAGGSSDEAEVLKWLVGLVQDVTDKPLCLDSPNPQVIKQVVTKCKMPPMINSITLDPNRLDPILGLAADHGAKLIGLCQSEEVMGNTLERKLDFAGRLVEKVTAFGINIENLYIDPLIFPVSTDSKTALVSLQAIERIMAQFPGAHTICGLTNVSYALPARKLVNRIFLVCALTRGLDAAILDPTDDELYAALRATELLLGRDDDCMDFISAYRQGRLG